MYDDIKELRSGNKISVDHPGVFALTQQEDFEVRGVRVFSQDDGEIVMVELDEFHLVAHTLTGDPRYYMYEEYASGTAAALDEEGLHPLDGEEFRARMRVKAGGKAVQCKAVNGPVYGLAVDRDDRGGDAQEVGCCEYRTSWKHHPLLLVVREDDRLVAYRGLRVPEDSIVL